MVVLPVQAPTQVPMASTRKGFWIPGMFPSSSSMPALPATPSTVPSVEKKSPQKAMNTYMMAWKDNSPLKSKQNTIFPQDETSGILAKVSGRVVTPRGIPITVTATIPMRMAPFTLYAVRTAMITRPSRAINTAGSLKFPIPIPFVKVPMPEFLKPR